MLGRFINPTLTRWTDALRRRRRLREMKHLRLATGEAREIKHDRTARCQNCKASLTGPFCHICGQKDSDLRRPIWTFVMEVLDNVFSIDGKIIQTMALLMTIPGGLTRSFMDGHRARFVPPVRLFIASFFMFFLILNVANIAILDVSLLSEAEYAAKNADMAKAQKAEPTVNKDGTIKKNVGPIGLTIETDKSKKVELTDKQKQNLAKLKEQTGVDVDKIVEDAQKNNSKINQRKEDFLGRIKIRGFAKIDPDEKRIAVTAEDLKGVINANDSDDWAIKIRDGLMKALEDPKRLNEVLNERAQWALLFVMPIFAILLRIFHWRKDQRLFEQLVFSLHYHAFVMLLMTAMIVVVPLFGGNIAANVFVWGSIGYMFIALIVGQRQGIIRSFFKFILIWPAYFIILTSFLGYWVVTGITELT